MGLSEMLRTTTSTLDASMARSALSLVGRTNIWPTGLAQWTNGDGQSVRRDISSQVSSVMAMGMLSTTLDTVSVSNRLKALVLIPEEYLPMNATTRIGGRNSTQKEANSAAEVTLYQVCSGATAVRSTASRWPSAARRNARNGMFASGPSTPKT